MEHRFASTGFQKAMQVIAKDPMLGFQRRGAATSAPLGDGRLEALR